MNEEQLFKNLNNIAKEFPTCAEATKNLSDALIKVGILLTDSLGEFKSLKDIIDELEESYDDKETKVNINYKKKNKKLKNWEKNKFYQR